MELPVAGACHMRVMTTMGVILGLATIAVGSPWEIDVVDSGFGSHASLRVGPGDHIHISYHAGSRQLKYAFFDGSGWTTEIADNEAGAGTHTSLAVGSAGHPRIAHQQSVTHSIRYSVWTENNAWMTTEFETDDDSEAFIALALDSADRPHIAYQDGALLTQSRDLKYAHFNGVTWTTTFVDAAGNVGRGSSMVLDSRGLAHISYYDESNVRLKHAHFDGTRWEVTTLDDVELIGFSFRTAIAVDAGDRIHIVYSAYHFENDAWFGRLRYAVYDGTQWALTTLDQALPSRDFRTPAITIDSMDRPHVTYVLYYNAEPVTDDLKYAWFDGTVWHIEFLDTGDVLSGYSSNSIDVDSQNRPHVSYARDDGLIHAVGAPPTAVKPSTWSRIKSTYR